MAEFDRITQGISNRAKEAGLTEEELIALLNEN